MIVGATDGVAAWDGVIATVVLAGCGVGVGIGVAGMGVSVGVGVTFGGALTQPEIISNTAAT